MNSRSSSPAGKPRRTQPERRAGTIEALLDATIATIAEVGYHRATTSAICARAGVTQGALFHHFETRIDLVVAALQRLTEQRIASYVEFAAQIEPGSEDPRSLLRMVGQLGRDAVALVWAELTVAARTDAELSARFQPAIEARWALIRSAAATFPGLATMSDGDREVWLQLLRGTIELAPLIEPLHIGGDPTQLDEGRTAALLALAVHLGARLPVAG